MPPVPPQQRATLPARRLRGEVEAMRLLLGGSLWAALGLLAHWLAGAVHRLFP